MCAARFGSKQVTRMLLEHLRHLEMDGYFLRQRNRFGLTPLEIARSENLDAAKVITKHLISYGHPTGAVLARSVSHHQLDPRRASGYARPSPPGAAVVAHHRAARAGLLAHDDFDIVSPSDYDSDSVAVGPLLGPHPRRPKLGAGPMDVAPPPPAAYNYHQAFYDPKAAEFSQYLLEQQQAGQSLRGRGAISDDDNDAEEFGTRAGSLLRSRSCMLGPSGSSQGQQQQQQKAAAATGYGSKKVQEQAGPSKMPVGWQDQSSGAAGQ